MAKPKTAYDVRRYITLVQVLAQDGIAGNVVQLCELWGIDPVLVNVAPAPIDHLATLQKLAQHVIEYHQNETDPKKLIVPREKPEGSTGTINVCG